MADKIPKPRQPHSSEQIANEGDLPPEQRRGDHDRLNGGGGGGGGGGNGGCGNSLVRSLVPAIGVAFVVVALRRLRK